MPISSKKPASPTYSQPTARRDARSEPAPALQRGEVVIAQCEHIRLSGQRCGSPALRGEPRCYFHNAARNPYTGGIPLPEDAASIQLGLSRVIRNLEGEPASSKNYALMLYALQTASANLKRVHEEAAIIAEATAEAQKADEPSLLDLIKQELELEEPPEGTCE
jgi:hypothetical protein